MTTKTIYQTKLSLKINLKIKIGRKELQKTCNDVERDVVDEEHNAKHRNYKDTSTGTKTALAKERHIQDESKEAREDKDKKQMEKEDRDKETNCYE